MTTNKPHRCDESCVCPDHGTPLIYSRYTADHACRDVDCRYGHGGAVSPIRQLCEDASRRAEAMERRAAWPAVDRDSQQDATAWRSIG
ncbi:hypothetical protein BOQ63_001540 (plasmid) [Streptomyces viridifaciens]|nr:hypothetical protein BOQ63_001540 [Streptomyces viridifaciens]